MHKLSLFTLIRSELYVVVHVASVVSQDRWSRYGISCTGHSTPPFHRHAVPKWRCRENCGVENDRIGLLTVHTVPKSSACMWISDSYSPLLPAAGSAIGAGGWAKDGA